jgi:hypothetical protein
VEHAVIKSTTTDSLRPIIFIYPDKMWWTWLFYEGAVADGVCLYVLERFFQSVLKKRVKITRYFSKTDRLAFSFRLGEFWHRKCPRKWIESVGPITLYPRFPKLTPRDSIFGVTIMLRLLTFHHCQQICHKLLERYEIMYSRHAYRRVKWTWIYLFWMLCY